MKPKKPRAKTHRQRMTALKTLIDQSVKGVSRAQMHDIAEELVASGLSLLSIVEERSERDAPLVLWTSDPIIDLLQAVSDFSRATRVPVEQVIDQTIMNIGPHVGHEHRWN